MRPAVKRPVQSAAPDIGIEILTHGCGAPVVTDLSHDWTGVKIPPWNVLVLVNFNYVINGIEFILG